jgi:hypothetical protein
MPPWERYNPNAPAAPATPGPWTKFQPAAPAAAPADTTKWREPGTIVPVQFSEDGQARWAVPKLVSDTIKAIEGPGKAMRGEYGLEIDPATGRPTPITNEMIGDAMGGASLGLTPLNPAAAAGAQFGKSVIGAPARRLIQKELSNAGIPLEQVGPRLAQLGEGAMYADLTPGLQARAAAIATMPGSGQKTIVDALTARRAGSNARIMTGVDEAIGPATVPSRMAAENLANKQALGPYYEALFQGPGVRAVDSSPIALNLESLAVNERGGAQAAANKVRGWLNVTGTDELDPNPYTLFRTRNAIDKIMATEADGGAIAVYADARKQIDELLAPAVPGLKELDGQYAELARQGDAVQTGQQLLDAGRTAPRPADVDEMMTAGALPQGAQIGPSAVPLRLREGARADIDRIIGTNIRDINAMKRIVAGDGNWNRDKLASVFGEEKAAQLLAILEREAKFDLTEQMALNGSRTDVLRSAKVDIEGAGPRVNPIRSAANLKFGDSIAELADRSLSWVSKGKRAGVNQQIADALISQADNPAMGAAISQRPKGMSEKVWLDVVRALAMQPGSEYSPSMVEQALLGPRR